MSGIVPLRATKDPEKVEEECDQMVRRKAAEVLLALPIELGTAMAILDMTKTFLICSGVD
jgi:hypothetical protein